jgi:predicted transcriptional regulator
MAIIEANGVKINSSEIFMKSGWFPEMEEAVGEWMRGGIRLPKVSSDGVQSKAYYGMKTTRRERVLAVFDEDEGLTLTDLAEILGESRDLLSASISEMARQGLLQVYGTNGKDKKGARVYGLPNQNIKVRIPIKNNGINTSKGTNAARIIAALEDKDLASRELADIIGTSTVTASRLCSAMSRIGLIYRHSNRRGREGGGAEYIYSSAKK